MLLPMLIFLTMQQYFERNPGCVIYGTPEFFNVTKAMHNGLRGTRTCTKQFSRHAPRARRSEPVSCAVGTLVERQSVRPKRSRT